jgi:hypothetical protein
VLGFKGGLQGATRLEQGQFGIGGLGENAPDGVVEAPVLRCLAECAGARPVAQRPDAAADGAEGSQLRGRQTTKLVDEKLDCVFGGDYLLAVPLVFI